MGAEKVYVEVIARFTPEGKLMPLSLRWEDGVSYPIQRVTEVCHRSSLKAGGAGIRYTCQFGRHFRFLFLEEDRWFVEREVR